MKPDKKALTLQRKILSQKIASWMSLSDPSRPPSGWLRAVRGALGITTRQLAALIGTNHAGIAALEKRETEGKVTIETLEKAAKAMGCRFVYAIIPDQPNHSLDEILDRRATTTAKRILGRIEHSMRLERQGSPDEEIAEEVKKLAHELKESLDSRLWETSAKKQSA
ncbi:MAG: mobile mystery protein A [Bdellovibrionales bacterium]|nr:mobile mystery protein A [Bdellovibrionales bacterium]